MKTVDSGFLAGLPSYSEDGSVHAVVEAPKGCLLKLKYDSKLGTFTVSRALPLGLSYPFDWGFIPSTKGPDGDPVDALILHAGSTYPGVVLACRLIGVVEMDEDNEQGRRERNDRLIVKPRWPDHLGEFKEASELPARLREEVEQFFLSTTFFSAKNAKVLGWRGPKEASAMVETGHRTYLQSGRKTES
ncbi:MAG: inorganic diphosphatase [Verrucomicrobia bacterium]|nr:inorganic diphosphatase [Verrucomicrobiota bacterium]